ncbi:MAG: hypothetical protein EPN22_10370 [Nitrospirae bacterium]|nr:MAG: hypothetical protein EPN22_10370 [Nitrospirota bacterium]
MRSNRLFKGVVFSFFAVCLIAAVFQGLGHSQVSGLYTGIPLSFEPEAVALNPETNVAVIVGGKEEEDGRGTASIINLNTQTVIATIAAGKEPVAVAIDSGLNIAAVVNKHKGSVSLVDLNANTVSATIPVGKKPESIAINETNHTALIAGSGKDGTISIIDLANYKLIGTAATGRGIKGMAVDSQLNIALLLTAQKEDDDDRNKDRTKYRRHSDKDIKNTKDTNKDDKGGFVLVLDLNTNRITGTIPVGRGAQSISINPDTHTAAVANKEDKTLTVINLNTLQTQTIQIGKHPKAVAINPLDNRAVVICEEDRSLMLVDLDTNAIVQTYDLTKEPEALAINPYTNIAAIADEQTRSLKLIQLPNPAPIIGSVSPAILSRGSETAKVRITGSKFIKTSTVILQTTSGASYTLPTTFFSNHILETDIPASLLKQTGIYRITVINPSPEGGASNIVELSVVNPVPQITSIDPAETTAGGSGLILTATGSGFFEDTTVYINGIQKPFTLINSTKLQIELTATDLETGGYLQITAANPAPGGGTSNPITLTVFNPAPILSSISPASVKAGGADITVTLTGSNFVKTSTISSNNQQITARYINSSTLEALIPAAMMTTAGSYQISITNPAPGGGVSTPISFTVTKKSNVEPLPEGAFGKQYEDLIPADATIKAYDPKRFTIVTGTVTDRTNNPLSGVAVSVHSHPEYGTASTDGNGRFSIPVEGGGALTFVYKKVGYITSHRQVNSSWNNIDIAEPVTMLTEDPIATTVTFDGNPSTVITHKSSVTSDQYGSRSATMVFTGDNKAYIKDANGNETLATTITTRVTEFDTLQSMPAKLPPTSAYTYCAEFAADNTQSVRFDKPVVTYVDNFLGFNVGTKVPVGYYDRERAVWVAEEDGVIVKLLDTNGDGIVDAVDSNGDGLPDDLNANGLYNDEASGLNDPTKYIPGATYMRVKISHFTPWDFNWPFGPPPDSTMPNPTSEPIGDSQLPPDCDKCTQTNSFVEHRSRIFHEDIPITGTDLTLHYTSNRVKGYKTVITIPASGAAVPPSLKSIIVKMELAGRTFETTLNPLPNQKGEFVWDGLDYLGNLVSGSRNANISIGFVYQAVYYSAGNFAQAFAQAGSDVTRIQARQEAISWKRSVLIVERGEGIAAAFGNGWTISNHHYLNPSYPNTLYKGDGAKSKNNALVITTAAGNGQWGFSGDGGPAAQASLRRPYGVAADSAGNIYIADYGNNRIRKVDTSGIITTVAGNGQEDFSGDGGPAAQASLDSPRSVAVDSAGNIYIADYGNNRIRKVDTSGIITTAAGNGQWGFSGDGGPAAQASLNYPVGLEVDNAGNIYIADSSNNRIRKVNANGIITTAAGNGQAGFSGDGGSAAQASLNYPIGLEVDNAGNIYIADYGNHRIRKVDANGIITTAAGNGQWDFSGDGGPAAQASLGSPRSVAVDSVGNLYIADSGSGRIRKVDANGIITTAAGNGQWGFSGDGGPAAQASLNFPRSVVVDSAGNIYIVDYWNKRIRKVSYPSAIKGLTSAGDTTFSDENGLGYIMDSVGLHKSTIDLATGKTLLTFGYDTNRKLSSVTDRFGNTTTIQRDGSGNPTYITSPDGITTGLTINTNGQLTKVTNPDGTNYAFSYTADGLMTDETKPRGDRYRHTYDASGRITNVYDPEGGSWSYARTVDNTGTIHTTETTAEGNITAYTDNNTSTGYASIQTDPTGRITLIRRSTDNMQETVEPSCGTKQTKQYDLDTQYKQRYLKQTTAVTPQGLIQTGLTAKTYQDINSDKVADIITDTITINNRNWINTNDTITGTVTTTSPLGRTTTQTYDPMTLLTQTKTIPNLNPTTYTHDLRGRLTAVTTGSRTTAIAYDQNGNIATITSPDGKTTTYSYDLMGRIRQTIRPDGTAIAYTYDPNGNMTILTNPQNTNHTFGYTANDQRKAYTAPISGSYQYTYDKERKLKTVTLPTGRLITNTYTNGLLTNTTTPEGTTTYTYDCGDNIAAITRGTEKNTFTYDGTLLKTDSRTGTINQTISYAYNNDFRLTTMSYAGITQTLSYDNDGLLTTAGTFTINRNQQNGLPESITDGAMTNTRAFSGYGELDGSAYMVNGSTPFAYQVSSRDNGGRITQKTETVGGATITWDYAYDQMGRLISVKNNGLTTESYTYDADGNRMTDGRRSYVYSAEDHLITAGTDSYQYNADGYLMSKTTSTGTTTFNYSTHGELLDALLPGGTTVSYDHDATGRRVAKRVNGAITEKYLWADAITLLAIFDANDNLKTRFNYADDRMPVSMTHNGQTYYFAYDQVGSLRVVTDTTGNVVKRIDYDSFGNITSDSNPSFAVPLGFAGSLHDRDTNLVRFGARDYDPSIGRWTAKDPIDFAGGINLFNYVEADPVNLIDPLGLDSLLFNGKGLYWLNNQGVPTKEYPSISGPFGKGKLPEGTYTGKNLRKRTKKGMKCPNSGWSLDLDPDFNTDRDDLRIHPDEPPIGTEGCIGVSCANARQLHTDLKDYLKNNSSIQVIVNYNLRVNTGE